MVKELKQTVFQTADGTLFTDKIKALEKQTELNFYKGIKKANNENELATSSVAYIYKFIKNNLDFIKKTIFDFEEIEEAKKNQISKAKESKHGLSITKNIEKEGGLSFFNKKK